jgi:hypothetical protein
VLIVPFALLAHALLADELTAPFALLANALRDDVLAAEAGVADGSFFLYDLLFASGFRFS